MTWADAIMLIAFFGVLYVLYRTTKQKDEVEGELARHIAAGLRRDRQGRFTEDDRP